MRRLGIVLALVMSSSTVLAVQFNGSQTAPTVWTYNLTVDPLDNYSVCQPNTTITINGLSGVTAAAGPTSTDHPNPAVQLAWTAQVLNGGTTVVWTHVGLGSGNLSTAYHINGFTITANAAAGIAPFATSGFERDGACPTQDLDISGNVAAPTATPAAVPALSHVALALLAIALSIGAVVVLRR